MKTIKLSEFGRLVSMNAYGKNEVLQNLSSVSTLVVVYEQIFSGISLKRHWVLMLLQILENIPSCSWNLKWVSSLILKRLKK